MSGSCQHSVPGPPPPLPAAQHIPVHQNVQSLDKVTNTPTEGVMFM